MRKAMLLSLAALATFATTQVTAQQPDSYAEPVSSQVSYSFDPVHAVMTATPPASFMIPGKLEPDTTAPPTATTYTGTAYVTFTVKLISAVPKGAVLRCGGNVGLEYLTQDQVTTNTAIGNFVTLSATQAVDATISNGTATCRLTMPYSWTVPPSTSRIIISLRGVTGSIGISETMAEPTDTATTVVTLRSTTAALAGPATPPADGGKIVLLASAVL